MSRFLVGPKAFLGDVEAFLALCMMAVIFLAFRLRVATSTLWAKIDENKEQIKILIALATIAAIILGYRDSRVEFQTKETLKYVKEYQDYGPQLALSAYWVTDEGRALLKDMREPSFRSRVAKAVREKKLENDLRRLVAFFRSVALCGSSEVCHLRTTCSFFFRDMKSFRSTYGAYLEQWNEEWKGDQFKDVDSFLKNSCQEESGAYLKEIEARRKAISAEPSKEIDESTDNEVRAGDPAALEATLLLEKLDVYYGRWPSRSCCGQFISGASGRCASA